MGWLGLVSLGIWKDKRHHNVLHRMMRSWAMASGVEKRTSVGDVFGCCFGDIDYIELLIPYFGVMGCPC